MTRIARGTTWQVAIALVTLAGCADTSALEAVAKPKPKAAKSDAGSTETVTPVQTVTSTTSPGATCTGQLSGAMPAAEWHPPHAKQAGACTAQEATALAACTLAKQPCTGISTACQQCGVSNLGAAASAALMIDPSGAASPQVNVEGCAAILLGDTSAAGCGPRLQAQYQCEGLACGGCDDAHGQQCTTTAIQGACATYAQAASQCAEAANACMSGASTNEVAVAIIGLLCGP